MPLRMSQISRPPLVGQKPVRKPKKKKRVFLERKINPKVLKRVVFFICSIDLFSF